MTKDLLLTDIARLAEVGVSAVSNWRKRHADFPRPTVVSGRELFAVDDVAGWLAKRKIPRNGLNTGEEPGTTYGTRFARNAGVVTSGIQTGSVPAPDEAQVDSINKLWQIMDLLRGDLEIGAARDFVIAMLYARTIDPDLWYEVRQQSSWKSVTSLLRDVQISGYNTPLLTSLPSNLADEKKLLETINLFDQIELGRVDSGTLFDALLERGNRDLGTRGGHFTPPSLVNFMIETFGPLSAHSVYDPSCGSGELLVAAAQRDAGSVSGQAINAGSFRMSSINLILHGAEAALRIGGPQIIGGAFYGEKFDVVLANPPFGLKLPENLDREAWPFGAPQRNADFAWLQHAVHRLKPGGRAAVLMPNGTLFTGGASAVIRRNMIEAGVVEGIVALPAGLFAGTGIPVSLWLLRGSNSGDLARSGVLFVDASGMGGGKWGNQRALREDEIHKIAREYQDWQNSVRTRTSAYATELARSVGLDDIRRNDYILEPRRYVHVSTSSQALLATTPSKKFGTLQSGIRELAEQFEVTSRVISKNLEALSDSPDREWRQISLGEICDIQAGPGAVDRERRGSEERWTPLVLPRNIKVGYLSHDALDRVDPEIESKLENYRLRVGDIVSARAGTLGRHGLVRNAENGWFAGPSCMRLRPHGGEVLPEYLVHYLNTPEVYEWITNVSHIATIPYISASRLRELKVMLPTVSVQQRIVNTLNSVDVIIDRYEQSLVKVRALRNLFFRSLIEG